jgi:hypothetical protein
MTPIKRSPEADIHEGGVQAAESSCNVNQGGKSRDRGSLLKR